MSRTSFYSKNYAGWPPVSVAAYSNPESEYWHQSAMFEANRLSARMGYEDYCTWLDTQPEPESWMALYHMLVEHARALDGSCSQNTANQVQA